MEWPFRKARTKTGKEGAVGIVETSNGISAVYGILRDTKTVIKAYTTKVAASVEEKQAALSQFVREHELQSVECSYMLSPGDYSLNLVDEPLVPKEEVSKALKWVIKDLINFPMEEAILDVFGLPFARAKDNVSMIYTAVTKKSVIAKIENLLAPTGMRLTCIDIPELSLKNIMQNYPDPSKGCLVMLLNAVGGKLVLMKDQQLCIARSFDIKLDGLGQHQAQDNQALESLALETQRSFDYINSVFRQNVQNVIVLAPTKIDKAIIASSLKQSLGMEVVFLQLSEIVTIEPEIQESETADCLLAIGTLLRPMEQSL